MDTSKVPFPRHGRIQSFAQVHLWVPSVFCHARFARCPLVVQGNLIYYLPCAVVSQARADGQFAAVNVYSDSSPVTGARL